MKKLNLKVGIAAFSVLLIGLVTAAVMTFNFADSENPLNIATMSDAVFADGQTMVTMIDRIIENSNSAETDDQDYHIVEITSGNPSTFNDFISSGNFTELIFNQHATNGQTFNPSANVTFASFNVGSIDDTAKEAIKKADLIYITQDSNKPFSQNNDIPTDLVSILSNFAIGDYKPLIIDTTGGGSGPGPAPGTITYEDLYRNVLANGRRRSRAYPSNAVTSPTAFNDYVNNGTTLLFYPIDGNRTNGNWDVADDGESIATILTIGNRDDYVEQLTHGANFVKDAGGNDTDYFNFDDLNMKNPGGIQQFYTLGNETPKYVRFEKVLPDAVLNDADLEIYDAVIVDGTCKTTPATEINKNTYLALRAYEMAGNNVFYDEKLIVPRGSSSNNSSEISTNAQNYKTILSKVSQAGKPAYSNIYVTTRTAFSSLITNVIPDAYDNNIVYIINNASFRGLGGSGDASNKFTLLEIEPEYPIDTILEKKYRTYASMNYAWYELQKEWYYGDGFYYLNTQNILNGITEDEVTFDGTKSLSDYYKYSYETVNIQVPTGNTVTKYREEPTGEYIESWEQKWAVFHPGDVIRFTGNISQFTCEEGYTGYVNNQRLTVKTVSNPYYGEYTYFLKLEPVTRQVPYEVPEYTTKSVQRKVKTDDNLSFGASDNLINYYSWTWSRAKLAYVTGKSYDEVEVVHMSSAEFNASLDSLNDTYDIIYIGGDNSAIKPVYYWYKRQGQNTYNERWGNINQYHTYEAFFKDFPIYNMYFTVGDTYELKLDYADNDGNNISGFSADSGNDLTEKRYKDLKKFAESGRPVIVGKDLYEAVTFDMSSPLALNYVDRNSHFMDTLNNKVDPNSNMFKLVNDWVSSSPSNIVLNFDFDDTVRTDNSDGSYGNTVSTFATVFRRTVAGDDGSIDLNAPTVADTDENLVRDYQGNRIPDSTKDSTGNNEVAYANGNDVYRTFMTSSKRPKFIVDSAPVLYSTGQYLSSGTLKFMVTLNQTSPDSKARIYIDDNGDGRFSNPDEIVSSPVKLVKGKSVAVSAKLKDDFSGPVFWKLEVFNSNKEEECASVTGVSAIKLKKKNPINILQILPTEAKSKPSGYPDSHIFLCKDCQESLQILTGGRLRNEEIVAPMDIDAIDTQGIIYNKQGINDDCTGGNPGFTGANQTPNVVNPTEENAYGFNFDAYMTNHNGHGNSTYKQLGVHEHKFGFADIQNSSINYNGGAYVENWNLNLFDNAKDQYDIRLTILTIQELNELAANIPTYLPKASASDYQNLASKYNQYFQAMSDLLDGEPAASYETDVTSILNDYPAFRGTLVSAANIATNVSGIKGAVNAMKGNYAANRGYFRNGHGDPSQEEFEEALQMIIDHDVYADMYLFNVGTAVGGYNYNGKTYNDYFVVWRNAKVLEQYFYQKSIYYQILASGGKLRTTITEDNADSGENQGAFGLVVLGAAENFANSGDQISAAATQLIVDYMTADASSSVDQPGEILLFHNTLTDKNARTVFSKTLRPLIGMDTSAERIANTNRLSSAAKVPTLAPIELTDVYGNYHYDSNTGTYTPKYGITVFSKNGMQGVDVTNPNFNAIQFYDGGRLGDVQTDYAQCSSTTKGIMTSFPQQNYTLNLTDPDVTPWYSLAGGTNHTDSDILVADLNDHANNYYLYTYKNVTFFGAGHMHHTGLNKLNSEESKLIINAILNASRPSAMAGNTELKLITHTNRNYPLTEIDEDNDDYKHYQYETSYSPDKLVDFEFGMQATTDMAKGVKIQYVDIFFDLDYDPTAATPSHTYKAGTDRPVYGCEFDANTGVRLPVTELINGVNISHISGDGIYAVDGDGNPISFIKSDGTAVYIDSAAFNAIFKNLGLTDDLFTPYNDEYTFLCVTVTDTKGNKVTKTIKIKKAPFLFDIT